MYGWEVGTAGPPADRLSTSWVDTASETSRGDYWGPGKAYDSKDNKTWQAGAKQRAEATDQQGRVGHQMKGAKNWFQSLNIFTPYSTNWGCILTKEEVLLWYERVHLKCCAKFKCNAFIPLTTHNEKRFTPVVCASWGLGCWQSLRASGWRSDPEFSCWPTVLHGPAGYLRLPPERIRGCTVCYIIRTVISLFVAIHLWTAKLSTHWGLGDMTIYIVEQEENINGYLPLSFILPLLESIGCDLILRTTTW